MLNIRDLRIDPASLGGKKLLVDIIPAYAYADGRRTDTVTGYRYVVACRTTSWRSSASRSRAGSSWKSRRVLRKWSSPGWS